MLIKHVKGIDIEDEYIKVEKNESVFEIVKKMQSTDIKILEHDDQMYTPILAAYVIEDGKVRGVMYHEDIIDQAVLKGKDIKNLTAQDIMRPPIICQSTQEVSEIVNLIIDKGLLTVAICDGKRLISVISVFDVIYLKEEM